MDGMARFGHNLGYVDELYRSYLADPDSVSESWREFFRGFGAAAPAAPASEPVTESATEREASPAPQGTATRLVGAPARIAANMEQSLGVPTATSAREVPVKLLEENRRLINAHQTTAGRPKVSFTHLVAWAVVRALEQHPRLNAAHAELDGKPHRIEPERIGLALAIDVERGGERLLVVPCLQDAARLDFPSFLEAYDDLVERARANRLGLDDFRGATITVTNPGTLGTTLSVPRLLPGQGAIVGVGAIGYPAEYSGMTAETISALGISKTMTVTSTYDHRVIQGAESGRFLHTLERLLVGEQAFYERLFAELGVPHEPFQHAQDAHPPHVAGAGAAAGSGAHESIAKQAAVLQLIRAYRVRGHLWADLDPLGFRPASIPELLLSTYGLTVWDLDREFIAGGLGRQRGLLELREILATLERTYCRHVGVEFMHIQDARCRHWLEERLEDPARAEPLPKTEQRRILERLDVAEAFEKFLHTNYVGQKRFSLQGNEALIPMLDFVLDDAAAAGFEEVVMGMAHRGRLNVLAHVLGKPYGQIFLEFEGGDPQSTHGSGDVKYHLGASGTHVDAEGRSLRVRLASNPSHLEAVDPVVQGMVRARQDALGDRERSRVLPILIHGDAAFAGQGVVAETLNASQLEGYSTGGTLHLVVNNQIGFTTGPADARSSTYATDVAKMIQAPIFHVNADHPEDAVRVARLALAYRLAFRRDVVVDLVGYRRFGHNEADDPSYTHPELYARIEAHRSVRKLYAERLMRGGQLAREEAEQALEHFARQLQHVHDEVRAARAEPSAERDATSADTERETTAEPDTSVETARLEEVLDGLERRPPGFATHPKLERQFAERRARFAQDRVDWSLAEALSFGSLLLEGTPVRLSGEDSVRGTFSQRHAALFDQRTGKPFLPLDHLRPEQAPFRAHDSLLSEFAVLGFEYGYSVDRPEALVLWEAQFGDFANGAQVIIDQFVVSAETKWGQANGLVMLLPHGFEGQGPEHSSARLERFLQLGAGNNLQVAAPSTPAQYFHLLRAQARLGRRAPLVVMTPKSLLRLPACVSSVVDIAQGAFRPVLDDPREPPPGRVRRLVLCAGKLYWDLDAERAKAGTSDVAILRLERLHPFPGEALASSLGRYPGVADVVWAQEEPRNMGAWDFIDEPLRELLGAGQELRYLGRPPSASPATGSLRRHQEEQARLVRQVLEATRSAPVV
jgi:2-oxoglutarate dehydrogenase E1 component